MGTLLDSLTSLATPAVGQIASRLGESDGAVARGVQAGLASVLGALSTRTSDPSSFSQIFDLVSSRPAGTDLTAEVQNMVGGLAAAAPASGTAAKFLSMLFGGRTGAAGDMLTRTAGFRNPSSGSSILNFAAPLVLGFLGDKVRDGGLSMTGLTKMLAGERDGILAAAPAGIANLFEGGEALRGAAATAGQYVGPKVKRSGGSKTWRWLFAFAAAVLAMFLVSRRNAKVELPPVGAGTATLDSAAGRVGAAVKSAAGEVGGALAGLGAFVERKLPGGIELNIPERGIESKLIAFIEDDSRPVNDTTWFDFDRLSFASGSATILPESKEQLDNIVAVLKAYPNVNVKVGGYTDNVGGPAANLRLSQQRADAVRRALVDNGIPGSRLQAEGYGEQHPVADNSTEEGRARNRRIALKVTKK